MPFYPPSDPSLTFEPVTLPDGFTENPEPHDGPRPSFGQALGAGFEIDNEVLGAIKGLDRENNFGEWDPSHNPWEQIQGTELEPYGDAFLSSRNQNNTDYIASAIREEIRNRKILEASHPLTAFVASGIASIASPTTLLPGGVIYRGLKVGRAAAKSAAAVGAANAAAAGIQEGILHSQQYARTGTESAFAVGGSFLLAGILGGAVSGMSSQSFRKLTTKLETDLQMPRAIDQEIASMTEAGKSAGAAAVAKPPADLKPAFGLEKLDLLGPSGRGMNADFPSMREFTTEAVELPTMTTRNALGITTAPRGGSIETRIKTQGEARLGEAVSIADNAWKSYRFGKDNPSLAERIGAIGKKPADKISEREFRQEIGKTLVRNDTHAIPEVQKAAREIRKAVIQPIAEEAIKLKKLDLVEVTKNLPNWLKNEMKPQQAGGVDPTAGMDANLRANIDGMLSRVEELTGQRIAPEQRKAAMAAVAGNEGLLNRLRDIFYGDANVPFALRDAGSRVGRSIDSIVDDLEDGYPVSMDRDLVDTVHANLADIRLGLPSAARNVPMNAFVGVEPVGKIRFDGQDVDGVSVSFRGVDGGFRSVELPIDIFRRARAFSLDGEVFVVTSEIVGQFDKRLAGEVRHELFHALRAQGLIPDDVFARLAAHANSLQILDMPYRAFAEAIGDDAARNAGPASLKKIYQNLHASSTAERLSSILDEEAGAHMVELWSHGKLTDEQLAPVMDDLVAMFGRPVPAGEGLKRVVDEWVGDLHGAIKVDGDGGVRFASNGGDIIADIANGKARYQSKFFEDDYSNLGEISEAITFEIEGILKDNGIDARFSGASRQSVSRYIEIDDGDRSFKLRISDHADRHGSDYTVRIDGKAEEVYANAETLERISKDEYNDLDGDKDIYDWIGHTIDRRDYDEAVRDGLRAVVNFLVDGDGGVRFAMRGGDADTGRSMRADLDRLGYYSGALEAAKSLRQAKGTPEQMLVMLGKEGAKKAELDAIGLPAFLQGKKSVTKDEIIGYLEENRVEVSEVDRGISSADKEYAANGLFGRGWNELSSAQQQEAIAELGRPHMQQSLEGEATKWSAYSLDPDNPTYRETVLHLPSGEKLPPVQSITKDGSDLAWHVRGGGWSESGRAATVVEAQAKIDAAINRAPNSGIRNPNDFRSGHFPEPNIVGHMMTSLTKHEGKAVFTIDQIQSDWGQKLRDGGVRDEAKIAELKQKIEVETKRRHEAFMRIYNASRNKDLEIIYKQLDAEIGQSQLGLLNAELRTAEAATPGHPLVNTTDQWVDTTLRRAIRQAAEADAEYIAIPSGKTVLSYNPGDEAGMEGFYNGIVPKNLRNLLRKIDKSSPDPIAIDKLETPTSGMKGEGFALFQLTDKVKQSVKEQGQPLFALRDLSRRIDAPLIDDLGKSDPHPGRVMALHGTRAQPFDQFDAAKSRDFGIHFGTSSQADIPAGFTTTRENARVLPVVLDLKTVVDVPDLMVWPPTEVAEAVERAYPLAGGLTDRVRAAIANHGGVDVGPTGSTRPSREALAAGKDELRRLMTSANIDGLRYWNDAEGEGWSYIVWDQGKVTSATSGEPMFAMRGDDILKKIRDLGGIKDETGDLSNMGAGERRGLINNETGLSPDVMREHLVQQGYLQDVQFDDVTKSSVNDLYDLIDNALRDQGGTGRAYRGEMAHQALRAVQDSLAKNGIEIKMTPEQEDAVVKMILDQRMSVDDAAEAIGMPPRGDGAPDGKPKTTSDPMRDVNARRIMQEIEDLLDDGTEDGVFSSATADEVWADGGESYGPRVWDRPRIIAQRPTVKAIIADYFGEAQTRAKGVLNRLMRDKRKLDAQAAASGKPPKMPADMVKDIDELTQFTSLSRQDLESTADQVIDHILGLQDGRMMTALPKSVRGSLKARTFHIPELFESASGRIEDFMDRDINVMMRQYVRSTVPDLEIIRRFGALDLQEQFARIGDDFKRNVDRLNLTEQKRASMTPEQIAKHERMAERERKRLDKARRNAERDLVGMVSRLRGERMDHMDPTAITTRAMRGVRQWNLITMLGGMTVSALPDIFRPMMVHGVRSYFMDGLRPLLTNIQAVKKAGAEIKTFGTALDMELNTRLQAFADVVDDYGRYSKFERGLGYVTEKFGVLSLMNAWNSSLKRVAGMMAMTNIVRTSQMVAVGSASKVDIERLAAAGIDAFDARIIAEQFTKHGAVDGGVYIPNTKAWDAADPNIRAALDSFKGAIVRDVDRTIVTPGQEKPLFMSTEVGATLMQFKTFGISSYQRTLVAGLQQRDSGVILGALLSVGMGMVVEHMKSLTNDKPLPKSDAQWIAAGLDRSGLLAYFSDVNNLVEKGSGGTLGIGALTGKELSRYASRNAMDALLGPSVGRGADIFAVTSGFSRALAGKDQVRESDIATFRRLIPFQNLFYLSYIFQKLEQATSRGIGAKPSKHRSPLMDRLSSNTYLDEIIQAA